MTSRTLPTDAVRVWLSAQSVGRVSLDEPAIPLLDVNDPNGYVNARWPHYDGDSWPRPPNVVPTTRPQSNTVRVRLPGLVINLLGARRATSAISSSSATVTVLGCLERTAAPSAERRADRP